MTEKEKLLLLSAVDEVLINSFAYDKHYTDEQRDKIADRLEEHGISSHKEIRDGFIALAHKLHSELN